jgi:transcriptional regulator with XRE-family HTH domain
MGTEKYTAEAVKRAKELREKQGLSYVEISRRTGIPQTTLKTWSAEQQWGKPPLQAAQAISDPLDPHVIEIEKLERKFQTKAAELQKMKTVHKSLQLRYAEMQKRLDIVEEIGPPIITPIKKKEKKGGTEATMLLVASDWHVEEIVNPDTINFLNEYNPEISKVRAENFFKSGQRLFEIIRRDVKATTIVLPMLGDFITNDIHDEMAENNAMLPMDAMIYAQNLFASGIKFLLEHTDCKIVLPCHSGNHARTTRQVHISTEHGHSLEYFMYKNLESSFSEEERVEFNVTTGYHSYLPIYDVMVRMHHGHAIKYAGGIGGIFIPTYKAIAKWNQAKHADLDIFGHFHQMKDGGSFLSNGSLIGYNAFALRIKADYEPPRQTFCVIDSKRGKTFTCPILV